MGDTYIQVWPDTRDETRIARRLSNVRSYFREGLRESVLRSNSIRVASYKSDTEPLM